MARPQARQVPVGSTRFSRKARLRKRADFENVYRGGRRIFSANMMVLFLLTGEGPARVGFTVGRALGGAVERNRIRRRMREAVRLNLAAIGGGVDVVIHPRKSARTADLAELSQEVAKAFGKIKSSAPWLRSGPAKDGHRSSAEEQT